MDLNGGALKFDALINRSDFDRQMASIEQRILGLYDRVDGQSQRLESAFSKLSATIGGAFSVAAVTGFVQQVVRTRGEFQQLEVAFTTMLKSKAAADQLMRESVQLAATTPFGLQDVASGAKQLLAYGTAAKDITGTLRMLGNVASGVGAPLNDIVYLYGTLQTQGRAYSKDIQQFTGRGIPIIKELASQFKVAESEVMGLVEAGKVGFPEVQKAFQSMTSSSGIFFNLMEEQSKTLIGQLANLSDAWDMMLNSLGESNEGVFSTAIELTTDLIENYERVLEILGILIATYGSYKAAVMLTTVAQSSLVASIGVYDIATKRMVVTETLAAASKRALAAAQGLYNVALAASPVLAFTALLSALGVVMYGLASITDAAEEAKNSLNEASEEGSKSADKEARKIEQLTGVIKSQTATIEQKKKAYSDLQESTNGVLKGYSMEEIAAGKAVKSLDDYIKKIREAATARAAFSEFNELAENLDELNRKGIDSVGVFTKLGRSLKNTFSSVNGRTWGQYFNELFSSNAADSRIVEQERARFSRAMDKLKKEFGNKFDEIITGTATGPSAENAVKARNKAYFEALVKENTEKLESLDKADKDFNAKAAPLKKKIQDAQRELLSFSVTKPGAADKFAESAAKRHADMLEKIYELNAKYNNKSISDDKRKLEEIRQDFKSLQNDIDEYNNDPKNKKVNVNLKPALEKALSGQRYETETEKLVESLQKQKTLYENFENDKAKIGAEAATERYKNEIDLSKAYADIVLEEFSKAQLDESAPADFRAARLKVLHEMVIAEARLEQQKNDDLLVQFQNYNKQRLAIQSKYLLLASDFRKKGADDEAKQSIADGEEEIRQLDEKHIRAWDSYKKVFDNVENLTKKQTLLAIAELEKQLNAEVAAGKAKSEVFKQIAKLRKSLEGQVSDDLLDAAQALREIAQGLDQIGINFGNLLGTISNAIAGLGQIQKQALTFKDKNATIGEKVTAGAGIVGTALSVVGGVVGYFKGLKQAKLEADRTIREFYSNAVKGELEYQALLRKRELDSAARGKTSYQSLVARLDALKKQAPELQSAYERVFAALQGQEFVDGIGYKHGTWLRKAKTWDIMATLAGADYARLEQLYLQGKLKDQAKADFEALRSLREELEKAGLDVEDLQKQLNEMLTGTSIEGLSDAFSDLFENGTYHALDFGNTLEGILKKAITNGFKYKYIEKAIEPLYDDLAKAGEDGVFTQQEIDSLRSKGLQIGETLSKQWDAITSSLDLDFLNDPSASTAGVLGRALTEDTANRVEGIWRSNYDLNKRQYELFERYMAENRFVDLTNALDRVLFHLARIDDSSAETAANSRRLESIETSLATIASNTKSTSLRDLPI